MNAQEFASLKARAKESWIKMERWRLAYRYDHKSLGKNADYLKWGTVLSGVLTGASSLTFLGEDPTKYLTAIAGIITSLLAVMEKVFQWESKAIEAWRNSKLLEDLQTDLYQYIWSVSANRPKESPENFLAKTSNKLSTYTSTPCSDPDQFLQTAIQASERLNFESMQIAEQVMFEENDDDDILPDDVDGVVGIQPMVSGGNF